MKTNAPDLVPQRGMLLQPAGQPPAKGSDVLAHPFVQIGPDLLQEGGAQVFSALHERRGEQDRRGLLRGGRTDGIDILSGGFGRATEAGQVAAGEIPPERKGGRQGTIRGRGGEGAEAGRPGRGKPVGDPSHPGPGRGFARFIRLACHQTETTGRCQGNLIIQCIHIL